MKSLAFLMVLGGLLLMNACEPVNPPESGVDLTAPPLSTPSPAVSTLPAITTPSPAGNPLTPTMDTPSPDADKMVRLSIEHLSQQLSISADQISVTNVTPITWRDASLGCPKRGVDYIRVETPGYNIVLESGGKAYTYHTDLAERVVLCDALGPFEIYMTP
jgi:hypothetical protein